MEVTELRHVYRRKMPELTCAEADVGVTEPCLMVEASWTDPCNDLEANKPDSCGFKGSRHESWSLEAAVGGPLSWTATGGIS